MERVDWMGTCNIPDHAELEADLAALRKLIGLNGFEVVDGDFTLRDGTRSKFFLRPNNVNRLLDRVADAYRREQQQTMPT